MNYKLNKSFTKKNITEIVCHNYYSKLLVDNVDPEKSYDDKKENGSTDLNIANKAINYDEKENELTDLNISNSNKEIILPNDIAHIIEEYIFGFNYKSTPIDMLFYNLIQDRLWLNITANDEYDIKKLYPFYSYDDYLQDGKHVDWYEEYNGICGIHDEENIRDFTLKKSRDERRYRGICRRVRGK